MHVPVSNARLFFLLLTHFPVLLSHHVCIFLCSQLNRKTHYDKLSALMLVESHKLKISNQDPRQEQRIDANFIPKLFDSAGKLFFSCICICFMYLKTRDDQLSLCALMAVESHKLQYNNKIINAWGKSRELMQTSSPNCLTVLENYFFQQYSAYKRKQDIQGVFNDWKSNNTVSNSLIKAWDSSRMKMQWIDGKRLGLISNWSISNLKSVTISDAIGKTTTNQFVLKGKWESRDKK